MENRTVLTGLTPPQADGRACCWCGARTGRLVPVGVSETGGRVVACAGGRDWGRPCQGLVWAFVGFHAAGLFDTVGEMRAELERRRAERVPVGPPADPRIRCA